MVQKLLIDHRLNECGEGVLRDSPEPSKINKCEHVAVSHTGKFSEGFTEKFPIRSFTTVVRNGYR